MFNSLHLTLNINILNVVYRDICSAEILLTHHHDLHKICGKPVTLLLFILSSDRISNW